MNRHSRWLMLGGLWLIVMVLTAQSTRAESDSQKKPLEVICLTERPAIIEGESTSLRTWVTSHDGQSVPLTWQVSDGTVRGTGTELQWDLTGVRIPDGESHKKVTATAKTATTSLGGAGCVVEVYIARKEPSGVEDPSKGTRGGLITGRRYLLPNEVEVSGYGLYSYLLLSAKPQNEEETKRYLATLQASLQMLNKLHALGRHVRPGQLNATHIPVTDLPNGKEDDPDFAKKVLAVYDFARAQVLLNKFETTYDRGPYLISVNSPLTQAQEPVSLYILQNFTGMVPDLAAREVRDFEFLAAQERTWTEQSMRVLTFKSLNLLAVAAKESRIVADSLKTLVQLIKLGE